MHRQDQRDIDITEETVNYLEAENAELKAQLSELREAAAWYLECNDFWGDGINMNGNFLEQEEELDISLWKAETALRSLTKG